MADRARVVYDPTDHLCYMDADALGIAMGAAPPVEQRTVRGEENIGRFPDCIVIGDLLPPGDGSPDGTWQWSAAGECRFGKGTAVLHPYDLLPLNLDIEVIAQAAAEGADHVLNDHTGAPRSLP